jgi:hypothetical protein
VPVPLAYRMRTQESPILPAAKLKSWRHICNLRQIDTKILQQTSRITANRDPGPDFPEISVLLENFSMYRLLQQAGCERKATYPPANNGDVTRSGHIYRPPQYQPSPGRCSPATHRYARR